MAARLCSVTTGGTKLTARSIRGSRLYQNYMDGLAPGWIVRSFDVKWAVPRYAPATQMVADIIMMFVDIQGLDDHGREFRTGALLRGQTVEILPIVIAPNGKQHILLVDQPRGAVGRNVLSTPAGMVDGNTVRFTALNELSQEIGVALEWSTPLWLNEEATGNASPFYVTPGGSNETSMHCSVTAHVNWAEFNSLQGHAAGAAEENEHTTVHVLPYDDFLLHYGRTVVTPCVKTLLSYCLHKEVMLRISS